LFCNIPLVATNIDRNKPIVDQPVHLMRHQQQPKENDSTTSSMTTWVNMGVIGKVKSVEVVEERVILITIQFGVTVILK
jgi:hypothetical protein